MQEIRIQERDANQRFDKFLKKYFKEASSGFLYKMLRKKNITLNNSKSDGSNLLKEGDIVKVFFSDETFNKMRGLASQTLEYYFFQNLECPKLNIIYEDSDILIINKPKGVLSQKAKADDISINEWVLHYLIASKALSSEEFATFKPSVLNRLDYNTSGLMLASKSLKGAQIISKALRDKTSKKYYYAVCAGKMEDNMELVGYLKKDSEVNLVNIISELGPNVNEAEYSRIETHFEVIKSNDEYSLVKVLLLTGKTHQIRAHLASIGHPIIGDMKYGDKKINDLFNKQHGIKSQLLHAYSFTLGEEEYIADLPREFKDFS